MRYFLIVALSLMVSLLAVNGAGQAASAPTAEEAAAFVRDAEARLAELSVPYARARWLRRTFITVDTEELEKKFAADNATLEVELAKGAARFDGVPVPQDVRRKLNLLKLQMISPAPRDPARVKRMTGLEVEMKSAYNQAKYCPSGKSGDECLDAQKISATMRTSRNPVVLFDVWRGWHDTAIPIRDEYQQYVALMNEGAKELGYHDAGALWRSKYEMSPEQFVAEVDRLWAQVKPLYQPLHCYVRSKLADRYGAELVKPGAPIPAHLLGNIWAQDWSNIYEFVAPPATTPLYDLTKNLESRADINELKMVRIGEQFFTSLGFEPLPATFWERSVFTKPPDRPVDCQGISTDVDDMEDVRLIMCIEKTEEDFTTIHHELGHDYARLAFRRQPYLYKATAHDGFDEAVGDAIALSVTPAYLKSIGLIDQEPPSSADVAILLQEALDKIAFLPFSIAVENWRWGVFSGEIPLDRYNQAWWDLRRRYQGIAPLQSRDEQFFDPGAKYHIPFNVPYVRYFLARILQFQLHRALCNTAGYQGPLNRCSIYGNKAAGAKLAKMLEMGISRPWPDALEAATGQRQMDASAIVDYFKPLVDWLEVQNRGRQCGWQ